MKVIGLAGRAGSGKSAVARYIARKPAVDWIDLDSVAWETYAMGTAVYNSLLEAFGETILGESGKIDRIRLAEAAFTSQRNQERLNAIVHPAVSDAVAVIIHEHRQKGTETLLVEGALLASSPHVDRSAYDLILWLDVPDEVRIDRLQATGRGDHGRRGDDVSPSGDFISIPGSGTIEKVAERILRAIDGEQG